MSRSHCWPALALLMLSFAMLAHAGEVRLRWIACAGDGGAANRDFACNTNTGSEVLVASFAPTTTVTDVLGIRANVAMAFAGTTVPAWWRFRAPGSCRINALTIGTALPPTAVNCVEWGGGSGSSSTYTTGTFIPNGAMLDVTSPAFPLTPFEIPSGQEYFAFTINLSHANTVGTGACAGCTAPGCMTLQSIELLRLEPAPPVRLFGFTGVRQETVTWQGGAGVAVPNFGGAGYTYCSGATPARASTWGAVKSLYR